MARTGGWSILSRRPQIKIVEAEAVLLALSSEGCRLREMNVSRCNHRVQSQMFLAL